MAGGGTLSLVFRETTVTCTALDDQGQPLRWAWLMAGGDALKAAVSAVNPSRITLRADGADYDFRLAPTGGTFRRMPDATLRILPNPAGKIVLQPGNPP